LVQRIVAACDHYSVTMPGLLQPDDRPTLPPKVRIVRPERVPVRTVRPSEAADFTPWLGGNLDFLDNLGLGPFAL